MLCVPVARAEPRHYPTATLQGPLGLNVVPSARMQESGTVSAGISTLDPYVHGYLGVQIASPLYINLRQSMEVSNVKDKPDRLYPGVDFKLKLAGETAITPEIALGLQNAVGHKRMAGEYLAFSKRWRDFDFTLGMGWGRFAGAAHFSNPLKIFGSHFGKTRNIDKEMPAGPSDWFTGDDIGVFGGVEYFTPLNGLSLKFDWGTDRYTMEKSTITGFDAPAPWSAGAVYRPASWIDFGVAAQGTDKVMGRISFNASPAKWPWGYKLSRDENTVPFRNDRTAHPEPEQAELSAEREEILIYATENSDAEIAATLDLDPSLTAPAQYGRAVKHLANHAGPDIEKITITPAVMNLRGPAVQLMRRDFEQAIARKQGSPQEIWRNAAFNSAHQGSEKIFGDPKAKRSIETRISLDNEVGLSEEDRGFLYRTSIIADIRTPQLLSALTAGTVLRLNVTDNLKKLDEFRLRPLLPVRSDIDEFTEHRIGLDRSYLGWTYSFSPETHMALAAGYLEEMYGGIGGEILYRPFGPRFAFGTDLWLAFKRDPETVMASGFTGDRLLTGHVNAWYDISGLDLTAQVRLGRYLAEDIGTTMALYKNFSNGAKIEGFITVTDQADFDLFGGVTHAYHGVRLSLPLGRIAKSERTWAQTRLAAMPFGRDTGQSLDAPLRLYELTEPFSYDHITRHWNHILEAPGGKAPEVFGPPRP